MFCYVLNSMHIWKAEKSAPTALGAHMFRVRVIWMQLTRFATRRAASVISRGHLSGMVVAKHNQNCLDFSDISEHD